MVYVGCQGGRSSIHAPTYWLPLSLQNRLRQKGASVSLKFLKGRDQLEVLSLTGK